VERLVRGYEESGLARVEYCRRAAISVGTLDYYRQRARRRGAAKLVRVHVEHAAQAPGTFAVVLTNGRRIESAWNFADGELARLIRIAESA
jgi:hypothetical protein